MTLLRQYGDLMLRRDGGFRSPGSVVKGRSEYMNVKPASSGNYKFTHINLLIRLILM